MKELRPDLANIKNAYEYLESLNIPYINALWDYMHIMIWHKGIDRVSWILSNKDLILEIIKYRFRTEVPEEINEKVWDSVYYYKNLDR